MTVSMQELVTMTDSEVLNHMAALISANGTCFMKQSQAFEVANRMRDIARYLDSIKELGAFGVISSPTENYTYLPSDDDESYKGLENVLERALEQASAGKGKERHAQGQRFEDQPMQTISRLINSPEGMRFQAIKKLQEAARLEPDHAVQELLGAINYIAGIIIYTEKR